ncbi:MAG: CDP-2,3-bis-(O-geranylgeranyl)-sn-glycerol synthase [Acidilobaceae archaeon]
MAVVVEEFLQAFLLILPAMLANATPVVFGGSRPIDGGRVFLDGRRLLGDGKTWEGLASGIAAGSLLGGLLAYALGDPLYAYAGVFSSLGAMLGDLAASFVKRRLGLERGAPAPLLDQLNFYVGALALLYVAGFRFTLSVVIALGLLSAIAHLAANVVAYLLRLKSVPW